MPPTVHIIVRSFFLTMVLAPIFLFAQNQKTELPVLPHLCFSGNSHKLNNAHKKQLDTILQIVAHFRDHSIVIISAEITENNKYNILIWDRASAVTHYLFDHATDTGKVILRYSTSEKNDKSISFRLELTELNKEPYPPHPFLLKNKPDQPILKKEQE